MWPCDPPGPPGQVPHTAGRSPTFLNFNQTVKLSSHSPGASIGLNAELWLPWEQSDANLAGSDWFLPELQLATCVAGGSQLSGLHRARHKKLGQKWKIENILGLGRGGQYKYIVLLNEF